MINAIKKPIPIKAELMTEPFEVKTLEGIMKGEAGDYLITGIRGEKYPIKYDIFHDTYRPQACRDCKYFPDISPVHCDKIKNIINRLDNACEKGEV